VKTNTLVAILVIAVMSCALPAEAERREAQVYAITTWDSGDCSGSTRSLWDDMGDAWYDEITYIGFELFGWCWWGHCDEAYSRDRRMVNGNIGNRLFTDPDMMSCGDDSLYVDDADAAMICMHGGDDSGYWRGSLRVDDGCDDCKINARDELRVGDWDLEFLHLSSCHSMDDNMVANAWRVFYDPYDSPGNGRRLHQLDGFHGCMWIGSSFISDYEDFAEDAFDMSIRDAWIDNMYRTGINAENYVQCPIAYAVGEDCSDCLDRLHHERYDNVYGDPGDIGCYCYTYYVNCDPACEDAWGSDTSN
jgi:hypothetical protein